MSTAAQPRWHSNEIKREQESGERGEEEENGQGRQGEWGEWRRGSRRRGPYPLVVADEVVGGDPSPVVMWSVEQGRWRRGRWAGCGQPRGVRVRMAQLA